MSWQKEHIVNTGVSPKSNYASCVGRFYLSYQFVAKNKIQNLQNLVGVNKSIGKDMNFESHTIDSTI